MLRIGLTGGIGSGKSTVAALLVRRGAALVDSDAIAHQLTAAGGAAIPSLRQAFGAEVIAADGSLDRSRVQTLVFSDATAKRTLEGILHPLIDAEATRQALNATGKALVFDVPLLVESSPWLARVDRVLVVDCRESTQIERAVRRPGWRKSAVRAVIEQQATRVARRQCADAVIYNDAVSLAQLAQEVNALLKRWLPSA
ncbi:MAG: dephospho-CoA kinase [Burkholderiaceae bacterium]|nr:dephospho-CoA kinase [Burkholderiaceae bacterium]